MPDKTTIETIDQYIAQCPPETHERLSIVRKTIAAAAPDATERMSWQMPTFYLYGNLIHFAAHKSHIGLYPGASGVEHFLDKLTDYKTSKGAIQMPNSEPLPLDLITEIVTFRVNENLTEHEKKIKK